ncbi:hypothetical protein LAUMK35_03047 [Mycobacterium pseudokansasii]|uniref:Uncharacterized protein n=1 Tax=Mycobacterium pseudokansasii TaxID=2341080 RepID=A0A498QSD4_9MYCO|nr:hypothetical protein A4G27_00435 [Mycobacterium kansasii]VAZ95553.1 hypothetical protein LAUMK35_03047 [Mycobacterium pseudokansasii]VAZ96917.1 hypothetical protein LAUMK21_03049 [Mycobacterium pseudokansasii]VBA51136.1 hypothetical protein LAUMK142_02951 [Mycobacterium pseudokansasii]
MRVGGVCVATASHLGGETTFAPTMVLDQIDGQWLGVAIGSDKCQGAPAEIWEVFTLQPGPGGSFTGEFAAMTSNDCVGKHTVTFTRIGDVDLNSLPDPATLPPRVVSPAEALRGSYHANNGPSGAGVSRNRRTMRSPPAVCVPAIGA